MKFENIVLMILAILGIASLVRAEIIFAGHCYYIRAVRLCWYCDDFKIC
jgi:hypothetical protein